MKTLESGALDIYGNPIPPNRSWMDEKITELMENAPFYTAQERVQLSEDLTEEHFDKFGFHAENQSLYRLSEFILSDELRSKRNNKSEGSEGYAILSGHQLLRRKEGVGVRRTAYKAREVPLSHASTIAINGKDYRRPIRMYRKK